VAEAARLAGVAEVTDVADLNHSVVCQYLAIRRAMGHVVDEVENPDH
jgi:hypothetical protein